MMEIYFSGYLINYNYSGWHLFVIPLYLSLHLTGHLHL